MSPRLIHTGQVIVDVVMAVPAVPEPGGDVIATSLNETAGGGLNVNVAAIRDELPIVFAGRYGSGHYGTIVGKALAASGATVVRRDPVPQDSGFCIALVDANTERTFVTCPGAEAELSLEDLQAAYVEAHDLVYITGYGLAHPYNAGALTEWLPMIPDSTTVLFDPSPLIETLDPGTVRRVLARVDVVSANPREGALMTGEADPEMIVLALASRVRAEAVVVVRAGPEGCWISDGGRAIELVPGFEVIAVDSNGAGGRALGCSAGGVVAWSDRRRRRTTRQRRRSPCCHRTRTGDRPDTSPDRSSRGRTPIIRFRTPSIRRPRS